MSRIVVEQDGVKRRTSGSFFRGSTTNFYPNDQSLKKNYAIDQYMTHGFMPKSGFVTKSTPIVAFGSCFAANISNYLHDRGFNILTKKASKAYVTQMGDGMVHTYAIRQQFEWAWLNKTPSLDLWHGYSAEEFGYSEAARADTKELFDTAEVFVITLGLSEIWYDEPTGEVFWRAIPKDRYDPERHKFRVATHAETLANIKAIHELIRYFRPEATIIFTVSPIPLTATFRPVACLSANAVSKATIRSAVDEFMLETAPADDRLFYFPSYDIVMYAFNNQWTEDRRHVYRHILNFNMKIFEHYYCDPALPKADLQAALDKAQRLDKLIGTLGHAAVAMKEKTEVEVEASPEAKREERRLQRKQARIQERVAQRIAAVSARRAAARAEKATAVAAE
ncbi:GSCFA domain-containing protein [Ancylobacter mangrovi]|uniref:GSCFA domain-containing protein n=1 Tax=Ancylobacter mangrovi TaxID=2972472 RepID=UPI00216295EE|nr:GSCFA domain-containing protein [Ancylobacter mangrovi]MCS0504131.1 GSCFA domain-containing protein [Ancylobacter mangrovi]